MSVLLSGHEGLDRRVFSMGLVDAREPSAAEVRSLPLYLEALLVAQPLHFGDYGGLPLKLVWAAFSLCTLVLGATGVVSFVGRRRHAVGGPS